MDVPRGISQVLQCFLWTMLTDIPRRPYVAGLIKHLWHRICHDPSQVLSLQGDLFWMPIIAQWRHVQAGSFHNLLHTVTRQLNSPCTSGEWGIHLATLTRQDEALSLSTHMIIPISIAADMHTLQDGVDAWEHSISRPLLHTPSETLFLSIERPCIRLQGDADAAEPAHRFQPVMGASVWMPGTTLEGHLGCIRYFQYELRTLLQGRSPGDESQADYSVMHWQMGKNTETATLMALIKYVMQFSD